MLDALKRYTGAIGGFAEIPRKRAEQIANALANQGLVSADQVRSLTSELARRGQENRERLLSLVRRELPKLGVATKAEVERLRLRIQTLEAAQRAAGRGSASPKRSRRGNVRPATRATAPKRAGAKRTTGKRSSPRKRIAPKIAPKKRATRARKGRKSTRRSRTS